MLLSIEGDEATGKTTLAYSAPLPIVGFAFDMGIERAIKGGKYEELFKGLDIHVVPYTPDNPEAITPKENWRGHDITIFELPQPIQLDSVRIRGAIKLWGYFLTILLEALTDPDVSTVVIDTMTLARRVKANAHLETLQLAAVDQHGDLLMVEGRPVKMREKLQQIEYGKVNDAIRDIYTTGSGVKKNLVATHHLTDEYVNLPTGQGGAIESTLSGNKVLEGLGNTHRFVDIAILTTKEDKKIKGRLEKCGYNLAQEGTVLDDPTWNKIANLMAIATGNRIELDRRTHGVPAK